MVFQAITHGAFGTVPILVADGLLATGFLILAFRYASLWLAAAMVLQAATFLIHASLLDGPAAAGGRHWITYYAAMNILGGLVMLVILRARRRWYRRTTRGATSDVQPTFGVAVASATPARISASAA